VSCIQPMFHLKVKTESARYRFGRDTIGHEVDSSAIVDRARFFAMNEGIEFAQEGNRLQIFATAVVIRQPLTRISREKSR